MSQAEQRRRDVLVQVVKRSLFGLLEAADALAELRDSRLYCATHKTWEAFCQAEFQYTRRHVNSRIAAGDTLRLLNDAARSVRLDNGRLGALDKNPGKPPIVALLPEKEAQVVELSTVSREKVAEAWNLAVERAGGRQPEKRIVRAIAAEVVGRKVRPALKITDRLAIQRAVSSLKSVAKSDKNISAALELLGKALESGAGKKVTS